MVNKMSVKQFRGITPGMIYVLISTVLLVSALFAMPAYAAAPNEAPPRVDQHCELPQSGELIQPGIAIAPDLSLPLTGDTGEPNLVITCVMFNRTHYLEGMQFHAEFIVKNFGGSTSESFSIYGHLCRYMENGVSFACYDDFGSVIPLISNEPGLEPGETVHLTSVERPFAPPLDEPASYESWVDGVPDNGTVYLFSSIGNANDGFSIAEAVYPTGPSNPAADLPGFIDEDGDGHSPPEDCVDSNPNAYPGNVDYTGNSFDDDCSGGDVSAGFCPGYVYRDECIHPGQPQNPGTADLDGDGSQVSDGDCDDTNPLVHPGAQELFDGIDNDCNGLIDEPWASADWMIESFNIWRDSEAIPINAYQSRNFPGLRYEVEIGNAGDYLGDDLSSMQAVSIVLPEIGVVATGTSGFIFYSALENGASYACQANGALAQISTDGINGETNFDNNWATDGLPQITTPDRSFHFAEAPALIYQHGEDSGVLFTNDELTGTCPDMPTMQSGNEIKELHRRVIVNDHLALDGTTTSASHVFELESSLSHGDRVCVEVWLDPGNLIMEDHSDNFWFQVFEYRNPVFGPSRFDLIEADHQGYYPVDYSPYGCTTDALPAHEQEGLIGSSPLISPSAALLLGGALLGLGGVGLGLAVVRMLSLGSLLALGTTMTLGAGGFLAGAGAGYAISSATLPAALLENPDILASNLDLDPTDTPTPTFAAPGPDDEDPIADCTLEQPICEIEAALTSGDEVGEREILLSVYILDRFLAGIGDDDYRISAELNVSSQGELIYDAGGVVDLNPNSAPSSGLSSEYVARLPISDNAEGLVDIEGIVFLRQVLGNGQFIELEQREVSITNFDVGLLRQSPPTTTPTFTPLPIIETVTPSPTVPIATPDTSGPNFKTISHTPDSIFQDNAGACTPNIAHFAVNVSDPAGVASVEVIVFHTLIEAVPLSYDGGDTWIGSIGPYAELGDGSVDYQIRATDNLGNLTESGVKEIPILACIP